MNSGCRPAATPGKMLQGAPAPLLAPCPGDHASVQGCRRHDAPRLFTRLDQVNLVLHECPASGRPRYALLQTKRSSSAQAPSRANARIAELIDPGARTRARNLEIKGAATIGVVTRDQPASLCVAGEPMKVAWIGIPPFPTPTFTPTQWSILSRTSRKQQRKNPGRR